MKTMKFKAESKQLLDLMINSIYSNKEVFLRELVSNASDALDKRQFMAIQDEDFKYDELFIEIKTDKDNRTITLIDSGIGMDLKDLENNLGTIAKSGSKEFIEMLKASNSETDSLNIIGQFGVGFYSAFIVAKEVIVKTKKGNNSCYKWISKGVDEYSVEEISGDFKGTEITLVLKDDNELSEFLEQTTIQSLIKKYSDYVKYPIYMEIVTTKMEAIDGSDEQIEVNEVERQVLNSQKALWKKDKKDITNEEYNDFYKSKYYDFSDPLHIIHAKAEGTFNYELMLFIPENKPFDYNMSTYKKGLDLYSKGILIDHNLDYLLDDCFGFVKGIVDSEDLNLNISREMLQKDATVTKLTTLIQKRIKKELLNLQKKKREQYEKLFENFGRMITYGVYDEYGKNKDLLKDLLMFKSSKNEAYVTLKEYVEANEEQETIYYVAGASIEKIKQMPQMEKVLEKDIEVLYFLNDVDEFAINILGEYEGKEFKSITNANLDLDTTEEKAEIEKQAEINADLLKVMSEALAGKVTEVKLTNKLKDSAVCLVNGEGLSLEMEKILAQMLENNGMKASKVLELNPTHQVFKSLEAIKDNQELITKYSKLLYNQALLVEGFELDDPKEYANLVDELIVKSIK